MELLPPLACFLGGFNIGWNTISSIEANTKTKLFDVDNSKPFILIIRDKGLSAVMCGMGYGTTSTAQNSIRFLTGFGADGTLLARFSIEDIGSDKCSVYFIPESARTSVRYKWFYL